MHGRVGKTGEEKKVRLPRRKKWVFGFFYFFSDEVRDFCGNVRLRPWMAKAESRRACCSSELRTAESDAGACLGLGWEKGAGLLWAALVLELYEFLNVGLFVLDLFIF